MASVMGPDYWCHRCNETVNPHPGALSCPRCTEGFIEQMPDRSSPSPRLFGLFHSPEGGGGGGGSGSISARRRRRSHFRDDDDGEGGPRLVVVGHSAIMEFMQALGSDNRTEANDESDSDSDTPERSERERGSDGLNVTLVLQRRFRGGLEENLGILFETEGRGSGGGGGGSRGLPRSLGDYFIGPGLDLLIQRLAENDPNRYGTPPASKSAVDKLPTVKIADEHLNSDFNQCVVCMEEFDLGGETRQMPCKHLYHQDCILPWLKLHSSCPVCRFQLPTEEQEDNSSKKTPPSDDSVNPSTSSSNNDNSAQRIQESAANNDNGASSSSSGGGGGGGGSGSGSGGGGGGGSSSNRRPPWLWNFFHSHSDNNGDGQGRGDST